MNDFTALGTLNGPEDDRGPVASKNQSGMDADSFPALRRLYMRMGFLLHDHGIETLQQLDSLLKSTDLKHVRQSMARKKTKIDPSQVSNMTD